METFAGKLLIDFQIILDKVLNLSGNFGEHLLSEFFRNVVGKI